MHVAIRNEKRTFLSQISNKGRKKCDFYRSSSHLQPRFAKTTIFGTVLTNYDGPAKEVLVSDLHF